MKNLCLLKKSAAISLNLLTKTKFINLRNFGGSSNALIIDKRNELFEKEQRRQFESVGRIEKIEIRCFGLQEDTTLVMNKDISTPYDCGLHLGEKFANNSALALINGNIAWDMHRPIQQSCTLKFLNFTSTDPFLVNKAFWRTCSFMLGAALQNCFKESVQLELHSFPGPNIKTGSFVYDVVLGNIQSWVPSKIELRAITREMIRLATKNLKIERLEVNHQLAIEMFKESRYKNQQLPSISQQNNGKVIIYRLGNHIDISCGPMVGSSSFLGKCSITTAHKIGTDTTATTTSNDADDGKIIYRVQGVATPRGFSPNHIHFNILEERARKLNTSRLPTKAPKELEIRIA